MVMTPFIMVIFGATGDLAQNKLIPALFALYLSSQLPRDFFIIGFSRRKLSYSEFHKLLAKEDSHEKWEEFSKHIYYQTGSFEKDDGNKELDRKLLEIDKKTGACVTRFFYLATPPDHY